METMEQFIVVIPTLVALCVGWLVKNVIPSDAVNRFIPLIAAVVGVGMNIWLNMGFTPQVLVGGLVSGLASTGMYELFNQFVNKNNKAEK